MPNPNLEQTLPSRIPGPVVGIGASAGGVKALLEFFEALPAHSGMTFIVVLHLPLDYDSNLASILRQATDMPVVPVVEPTLTAPDHVYLVAPSCEPTIVDGLLGTRPAGGAEEPSGTIDRFLRTLAEAYREHAVGVVLSGAGSDGALGVTRVKEMGGITLAQTPGEAEYDSMPCSAIATGTIDFVLPASEMPQRLLDLQHKAREIRQHAADAWDEHRLDQLSGSNERALREIMVILRTRTTHDFRHYKRATVLRRLERRMQVNGIVGLQEYRDFLHVHPDETQALLQDMLISVTNFFRDREAFDLLEHEVLPKLVKDRPADERIRVWSAGCATGEESYSLAMLLQEAAARTPHGAAFQVFATDIDEQAIAHARNGLYSEAVAGDIPPARLRQFFAREGNQYRIRKELREHMLFAIHNVLSDPPFSRLDLVCCRNLLIYLDREAQIEILKMFHFALRPGGYLFLGSSESADSVSELFSVVDKRGRIYRANIAVRSDTPLPITVAGSLNLKPAAAAARPVGRRKFSFGDLHQRLVEQYAPPSVLVNRESEIVHLSDRAGRFLQYAGGEPSHNIVAAVRPELRLELRTAIFQALQTDRSVEARPVRLERDGRSYFVSMTTRPVHDAQANADFVLVLFDEVEDSMSGSEIAASDVHKDPIVAQLERELQRTKDQLQATIEQSETSTEELKASNEELQAINEELRSATEELETSKEELQSINEELTTVNAELKVKVEETGKINDDLQNLIAANDIGTIFVDRNICIKRYTPRATEVFSIIASDIGRSLLDITHRLEYDRLAADAAEAFDSLRLIERELRSTDGRWYLARFLPYRTTEDRIDGAVLSFIEITERRHAEERLREGERRARIVAESVKDYAIISFDEHGRVTSWNAGAGRMFGYGEAEMMGRDAALLYTAEDRERGVPAQEFQTARALGRIEEERWHLRKDGTRFYTTGVLTRLDEDGVHGFAKIAREIDTAVPRYDDVVRRREASEAERRRDEFLAVVSHELKHPLNLISASAELIARSAESRQSVAIARAADTIRRTVVSQAQIIDDLLDMSRMRTGKLSVVRSAVDWRDIVTRIGHAVREEAEHRGVSLALRVPERSVVVHADLTRVEQITWNLVSNALKFTGAGQRIDIELGVADGDEAVLAVADTGAGIDPEFLPHVFDMFQQSRKASAAGKSGLGIGLALVKEIVALHGGSVDADSAGVGHGARFTVRLPLRRTFAARQTRNDVVPVSLAGRRLLLLDDDATTVETFKLLLEAEGAEVRVATSGAEALDLLDSYTPDAILSDIGMPDMDGFDFVSAVRQRPSHAGVLAIALSGYGNESDVARAREAGFDAHLPKPVMLDDLLAMLANLPRRDPSADAPLR